MRVRLVVDVEIESLGNLVDLSALMLKTGKDAEESITQAATSDNLHFKNVTSDVHLLA
jgi:hypothetical protein